VQFNGVYYAPPRAGAPGALPDAETAYTFRYPRPPRPRAMRIYECHVGMSSAEPKARAPHPARGVGVWSREFHPSRHRRGRALHQERVHPGREGFATLLSEPASISEVSKGALVPRQAATPGLTVGPPRAPCHSRQQPTVRTPAAAPGAPRAPDPGRPRGAPDQLVSGVPARHAAAHPRARLQHDPDHGHPGARVLRLLRLPRDELFCCATLSLPYLGYMVGIPFPTPVPTPMPARAAARGLRRAPSPCWAPPCAYYAGALPAPSPARPWPSASGSALSQGTAACWSRPRQGWWPQGPPCISEERCAAGQALTHAAHRTRSRCLHMGTWRPAVAPPVLRRSAARRQASSRCGTPDELKAMIDEAHHLGLTARPPPKCKT